MAGRFLLDTNIVIALFAGESAVYNEFDNADEVFLSSIVLGELYYGARKSAKTAENIERIDAFAASNPILACDMDTSRYYGIIKESLRVKGKMLPENDTWIAAMAMQYILTVATRDAHFNDVDGLSVANW